MSERVLILGAGFGGLELATVLSEELGEEVETTLIDRAEGFVLGYSKLELMLGRATAEEVRFPYAELDRPGVRLLRESVRSIDPRARTVETDAGRHEADHLVVALGAEYDPGATPGLAETGHDFYSVAGAERLAGTLPGFAAGRIVIGICGAPLKCPPAPSEAALMIHGDLERRGVRDRCEISVVSPLKSPVPPSPAASAALLDAFAERGIEFRPETAIESLDPATGAARIAGGEEVPCDLFLGVPRHVAPAPVRDAGLAPGGFVAIDPDTLETPFPGVFAIGDVADAGVPKAGVFAERAGRHVAAAIADRARGTRRAGAYDRRGACYVEFGAGEVGRVDVDFSAGPPPADRFNRPSAEIAAEKRRFGADRRARWFGAPDLA